MKLTSTILGFGAAAAMAAACSSTGTGPSGPSSSNTHNGGGGPGGPSDTNIGAVGMDLTLPGNEHISSVSYTLKNAANTYTGTYNVADASIISFVIGSVAAGTGYSLQLSATSDDGKDTCSFPAPGDPLTSNINVVNRTTTIVNVNMQCVNNQGLDSGAVLATAVQSNCPVWNTIVVNPENITLDGSNVNTSGTPGTSVAFMPSQSIVAQILDGQQAVVVGSGTGPNQGALTFLWTLDNGGVDAGANIGPSGGTLDPNGTTQPNGQSATNQTIFTCPPAGTPTQTFTIHMHMTDGPVPDGGGCDSTSTDGTVQITCSNPQACGGNPVAAADAAVGAESCQTSSTNTAPAPNGGTNNAPWAANGTFDQGFQCCSLICQNTGTGGGPGPVANPPTSAGTCSGGLVNNGSGCCVPLLPCTTAGQLNCVKCQGNDKTTGALANGLCTPTEALFVQRDITKLQVTAPGNDANASTTPGTETCYQCLYNSTCLDDTHFGDTGHECGDSVITIGTSAQCMAVLSCVLGSGGPTCSSSAISTCYCGSAGLTTTCQGNPNSANGTCDAQIAAGLGFPTQDGTDNLAHFTDGNRAGGVADQLFNCAVNSGCTQCLN